MKFLGQGFQEIELRQTDRQTDRYDEMHYHTAFVSGKDYNTTCIK